jgi:hypothetical protein
MLAAVRTQILTEQWWRCRPASVCDVLTGQGAAERRDVRQLLIRPSGVATAHSDAYLLNDAAIAAEVICDVATQQ